MARSPSPRNDARRRSAAAPRGWDSSDEDAPWLDEADFEDDRQTKTMVGRSTLKWIIGLLAVLALGITVGILLVSKRESTPIDVPAVGEAVPVLKSPGPWKTAPVGEDVDGIPVEGQGQILFGTGQGRDIDSQIDITSMPEDPLDKPGTLPENPVSDGNAPRPAAKPPTVILPEGLRGQPSEPVKTMPLPTAPAAAPPAQPAPLPPARPSQPAAVPAPPAAAKPAPPTTDVGAGDNGTTIQLGAFSTQARALAAFKSLSSRFSYLAGAEPHVVPTSRDGQTLYRLRVEAGAAAAARDMCNRLKLAGEACTIVN